MRSAVIILALVIGAATVSGEPRRLLQSDSSSLNNLLMSSDFDKIGKGDAHTQNVLQLYLAYLHGLCSHSSLSLGNARSLISPQHGPFTAHA